MMAKTASDRTNRVVVAVLGVLLLAVGVYGLARGWGAFGSRRAHQALLTAWLRMTVHDHNEAFWAGVLVLATVIAYLGYRWLRAQLPVARHTESFRFADDDEPTELRAAAVASALADDLERHPSVVAAAARVDAGAPLGVELRVDVEDGGDVAAVRAFVDGDVLARLRQALELQADQVNVRLHVRLADDATRHLN